MHPYLRDIEAGAPLSFDEALAALAEPLDLLAELERTPQDPGWHAEGDVATHTAMVLEELEAALARGEHEALGPRARFRVRLAALLHDVAKPLVTTTRIIEGRERVVAPGHARRGASYLSYRLLELGLAPQDLLAVLGLVRHHHDPKHLILRDRPRGAYLRLARQAPARQLHALELADMRGRRCADRCEQIEFIELFGLGAQEAGTWGAPRGAPADFVAHVVEALRERGLSPDRIERALMEGLWALEDGVIYTPEEACARAWGLEERFCRLVLTFGPSGSGKSSWVAEHLPGHEVIALDELRAEITGSADDQSQNGRVLAAARERLREALRAERDVVWDATSLRDDFRAPLTRLGRDYLAHVTLLVFHTPRQVCHERNRARQRSVPAEVFARQFEVLQWPGDREAHRVLVLDEAGQIAHDSRTGWRGDATPGADPSKT